MTNLIYEEETYRIRGAIFEVYRLMGAGFLEEVYQECLERDFAIRQVPFEAQKQLTLYYKEEMLKKFYVPDFVCFDKIIVELKAVRELVGEHRAQVLNYLKATGYKVGLLVNFGATPKVEIERVVL